MIGNVREDDYEEDDRSPHEPSTIDLFNFLSFKTFFDHSLLTVCYDALLRLREQRDQRDQREQRGLA